MFRANLEPWKVFITSGRLLGTLVGASSQNCWCSPNLDGVHFMVLTACTFSNKLFFVNIIIIIQLHHRLKELRHQQDIEVMKKCHVIGMTVTGATMRANLLGKVFPLLQFYTA